MDDRVTLVVQYLPYLRLLIAIGTPNARRQNAQNPTRYMVCPLFGQDGLVIIDFSKIQLKISL